MNTRAQRGSALITAVVMVAVILGIVTALMVYANHKRSRAISVSRGATRFACAQAGLELAKNYYGRNFTQWNTYLGTPSNYNPIKTPSNITPADPNNSVLQLGHPELFADLDNDGKVDVYIYIRDNQDELPPALNTWTADNDQNALVGSVCISQTLVPRTESGILAPESLTSEALLSFNSVVGGGAQKTGGSGGGNYN